MLVDIHNQAKNCFPNTCKGHITLDCRNYKNLKKLTLSMNNLQKYKNDAENISQLKEFYEIHQCKLIFIIAFNNIKL